MTGNSTTKVANEPAVNSAEQDMLFKIKLAISEDGRYADMLNDVATGYAAAKGTEMATARREIEQKFEQVFGRSPHEHLERHFEQRRSNGRPRERSADRGMGR